MKVVEKDNLIEGMLREELERCRDLVRSLEREIARLPKGSLHVRRKRYGKKLYSYHYLKYREGEKSISQHVPAGRVEELQQKIADRKRYAEELRLNKARIRYLEKLLKKGR